MNLVLSVLAGVGLFLVLLGLADLLHLRPRSSTHVLEGLLRESDQTGSAQKRFSTGASLVSLLYQARAPLSVAEFLWTSLALGLVLAAGMFLATGGALLLTLVMFGLGAFLYYLYLSARRDRLARAYEEVQPQVVYTLYFYLKANGLDFRGAVEHVSRTGPEIVREDWQRVAASLSAGRVNVEATNELLTYRNSPSFTRIVEALLLFRGENVAQLPRVLDDLRRDISLEVEISREAATYVFGARRQLLLVALMPAALSIVFMLMMPSFREFYQSVFGQLLLLGIWAFSALVYGIGARSAGKASMVRPYTITFPEARPASVYLPTSAAPEVRPIPADLPGSLFEEGDEP